MYPVELASCDASHWDNSMSDDKPKTKKPNKKSSSKKKQRSRKVTSFGMTVEAMNECLEILLRYRKKSRSFRQRVIDLKNANRVTRMRIIREIVQTLEELENGARSTAESLRVRIPLSKPLKQADLAEYIAGRKAREAP
jgi:hypothetical protein